MDAKDIIALATNGGFAALLWYFVVKHIPAITSTHLSERKEWLDYIKSRDAQHENRESKYGSLVERCIAAIEHINGKH